MTERGPSPEETGLSQQLERLLQAYSAKLDAIDLKLPQAGATAQRPEPPVFQDYFPDEPAAFPPLPPESVATSAKPRQLPWLAQLVKNLFSRAKPPEPPASVAPEQPRAPKVESPAAHVVKDEPPAPPGELCEVAAAVPAAPAIAPPTEEERRSGPVARPFEPPRQAVSAESALRLGLALAAALAAFGLWRVARVLSQAPHRFFPLQGQKLSALAGNGASVFVYDQGRLLEVSSEGSARAAGPLSGGPALGLARDDAGHFWSSEDGQAVLFEHGLESAHAIVKAYPYPNRHFSQIAVAGDSLWALDSETGAAYQYMLSRSLLGTSLTPISQFDGVPETMVAAGLSAAQGLLWVCDPSQRRVVRLRPEGSRLAPVDSLDLSPWVAPGSRVTGMTLAGGYLWVLTGWPAGLHRLRLDSLAWRRS